MNVLCIKEGEWILYKAGFIHPNRFPIYGEVLTTSFSAGDYYFIDECEGFFNKKEFIPCSDVNEEELVNTKEEAYAG